MLFLLIFAGQYLNAQTLLVESFNYKSGTILSSANWNVVTGSSATNVVSVAEGNLSYPGANLNTIGNKVVLNNIGQNVFRSFSSLPGPVYSAFIINVSAAHPKGDFFYSIGTTAVPMSTLGAKVFVRSNGAGFSFGVLRGTGGIPVYEETVRPFDTNIMLVLKYEIVEGDKNDMVKLYVNPDLTSEPIQPTVMYNGAVGNDNGALSAIALVQGNASNGPLLTIDGIVVGVKWRNVAAAIFDYGDVPKSYDHNKDGIYTPAQHQVLDGLMLGKIMPDKELLPLSVEPAADNNGSNGDGLDEDALLITNENSIRKAVAYSIRVPVANPVSRVNYLYGWIDFNNDGKFQANEMADAVVTFNDLGLSEKTLTWSSSKTNTIPEDVDKLYMRLRLSDRSLIDFVQTATGGDLLDERSIGNGATTTSNPIDHLNSANGEVEDYQILIARDYDYGDLPESYEKNKDGALFPALHAHYEGFTLGKLIDTELKPASVIAGTENNIAGDNANDLADEDALEKLLSVSRGVPYSISMPVNIPKALGEIKYIYGWIDLNADGRFQVDEVAVTSINSSVVGQTNVTLTWTAAQTNLIAASTEKIYLRIRLSQLPLVDFTTANAGGALVDERSIGNGATTVNNAEPPATITYGEVEDYQLYVDRYDFGDAPLSYEKNQAGVSRPARHIVNPFFTIGSLIDEERNANSVAAGADNNGENGDGLEEDGVHTIPTITRNSPFSFSVPVSSDIRANIIAWIDFNNNGRFDEGEAAYATLGGTVRGYQAVPIGTTTVTFWFNQAQTRLIPNAVNHLYARIRLTQRLGVDNTSTAELDERAIGDGLNTGEYDFASSGEIEDYRFIVGADLYDFGDAPVSYDMDKKGQANPANFKPARNIPSPALHLGSTYTVESGPHAVAAGADNNGENGDGLSDDGLSSEQLNIKASGINRFTIELNNNTGANAFLYAWIDFNTNGRFEAAEASNSILVANKATSAEITFTDAQMKLIPPGVDKVYMRLRLIQAAAGVTIGDLLTGANSEIVDERAIADGTNTGEYSVVSLGEVEDYQLSINRDYGDVPSSYENGNPASHSNTSTGELIIGKTIDYEITNAPVLPGADNNNENGDGLDEDGVTTPMIITSGESFSLKVPITSEIRGTAYMRAWIDFNGDGIFNGNEVVEASTPVVQGASNFILLKWSEAATNASASVLSAGKTYLRLRLSETNFPANTNNHDLTLIDSRSFGPMSGSGEVEDYQFLVVDKQYDFGDAPDAYNRNRDDALVAPRQTISPLLHLGETIDVEAAAHSVAMGADNNGLNGDGADEDGITELLPVYKGSPYYSTVSVFNNTGASKILYGWIDFNNDGYFQDAEVATITVPSSDKQQALTLRWLGNALTSGAIPDGVTNLYMRLRISDINLIDNTSGVPGQLLDERSIADGLSSGLYGKAAAGEVEDYRLEVALDFDYGDAPNSYDTNRDAAIVPARQAVSEGLYIGEKPADAEAAKQTSTNALGDDEHGDNDEGGLLLSAIYKGGGSEYSINVPVTNMTGVARRLYAWIDFNNNGRYEAKEMQSVSVPNGSENTLFSLSWTAAQTVIVGNPSQLYMRLRIADESLVDFTTGASGALVDERAIGDGLASGLYGTKVGLGEIEDHSISILNNLDYGDVPESYEYNDKNEFLPARHLADPRLILGSKIDVEVGPQSVAAGADNNGENGDGLDEDGITGVLPILIPGTGYSVMATVTNHLPVEAWVHAWIDFNADGRFSADEYTTVHLPANSGKQTVKLSWYTSTYSGEGKYTYMRVRVSSAPFADNSTTLDIDERSIGDGLATGQYGAYPVDGEVEDYQLEVDQSVAIPQDCEETDNRLGRLSPIKGLYHSSIVKTVNGEFLVFGALANPNGNDQMTPIKVESGKNGFKFSGTPLIVVGYSHQYFLLSSAGLYTWGDKYGGTGGNIFESAVQMSQVPLPTGISPAQIQNMDAGYSVDAALMLLTKTGEVWVRSNIDGGNVNGNGNEATLKWHQVMLNATTALTGMKDVMTSGSAGLATDGHRFYTWGTAVNLGDGQPATNKAYATLMETPYGISLPVKQQAISQGVLGNSASYYLRDAEGKVFVLGGNKRGQLGLGTTNEQLEWSSISFMIDRVTLAGAGRDETKPIKKAIWISASSSDGNYPHFGLITEENHFYTVASNKTQVTSHEAIGGAPHATNIMIPNSATQNNGKEMLEGKMIFSSAGGHISILVKDKSDRYGYTGHTDQGSDGCGGCTVHPAEFDFVNPPSTGPVCGNRAFDYGDLDDRYNLGDQASHEIKFSQIDNPLKLGKIAADSDDGPQFEFTGPENNADGDDFDGKGGLIDEDAFVSGEMPPKIAGEAYTLKIPYTNNTGKMAYLYAFIDWNNNGVFELEEGIIEEAPPGIDQIVEVTWEDTGIVDGCDDELMRSFVRLRLTTDQLKDDPDTPEDDRSHVKANDGEVEDYYIDWVCPEIEFCYLPGATAGDELDTFLGISSFGRAGNINQDKWPMVRKGAWLVLESKTKGFVLNRVSFNALGLPIGIPEDNFVEGMLVYDTTNNCLKMYTSNNKGVSYGWHSIERQFCPE